MPHSTRSVCRRVTAGVGCASLTAALFLFLSTAVETQDRPPLLEPIALEGTTNQFYRGANVVIVTMLDGVEQVYQFTKNLIVHGGKKPGIDALEGLDDGTTVVIRYPASGPQAAVEEIDRVGSGGLEMTEGVVTDIDRRKQEITIAYANGQTKTLQMTTRVAAERRGVGDESSEGETHVIVSYADESGRKVAHYFREVRDSNTKSSAKDPTPVQEISRSDSKEAGNTGARAEP